MFSFYFQAIAIGPISKSSGTLLYVLGTKLPKQFHQHFPFLIDYIVKEKINLEAKLTAAMKFVQVSFIRNLFFG